MTDGIDTVALHAHSIASLRRRMCLAPTPPTLWRLIAMDWSDCDRFVMKVAAPPCFLGYTGYSALSYCAASPGWSWDPIIPAIRLSAERVQVTCDARGAAG